MSEPASPALAGVQTDLYRRDAADGTVRYPVAVDALEKAAYAAMTPAAADFLAGGAGRELTVRANRAAFERWAIVPRMLRGSTGLDLSTTVLGTQMPAPIMLAPVGIQSLAHPDAEAGSARAAARLGLPFILSTASTIPMEQVAAGAGPGPRWFQLYWPRTRDLALSLVGRAEAAGYSAVVITVDTPMVGWRPRDLDHAHLPMLAGAGIANYTSDPVFRSMLADDRLETAAAAVAANFADPNLSWDDISWLGSQTRLPLVIKGISCAQDAVLARDAGVGGLVVSNHGGRQLDGAVATLDVLPEVVDAVPGLPVLLDGGVRCAADVVKALALGASAVVVGRLFMWGLALGGEAGVLHALRMLMGELETTMVVAGYGTLDSLDRQSVRRVDQSPAVG
ncbi:MAG: lactate 2-monooxygenase [Mycobacteriales bacterium]